MKFDEKIESIIESNGYVETMGPDFDKGIELIRKAWEDWRNGPATERSDIKPAQRDIIDYVKNILK